MPVADLEQSGTRSTRACRTTTAAPGARPAPREESGPDTQYPGPAVPRMVLGARLRRLREAQFITREEAGEAIRMPYHGIRRMEAGHTGFRKRDVVDLLTIYGVTDETERLDLLALAEQANRTAWWQPYADVVPDWFAPYLRLEQAATVIRSYEPHFIPGLLQTPDYARAVIGLGNPPDREREIGRRVTLRTRRQRILRRAEPPHLWTVVDEAALRRPMGGPEIMRAQLRHLIDLCASPRITVQVVPFEAGGHAVAGGPVTLLRLAERELPDVVYLEHLAGACYPDDPEEVHQYRSALNDLATVAAPATETPALLRDVLRTL